MPAKTKHVSYRISAELASELMRQAEAVGQRPNGFACAALIETLERGRMEMPLTELHAELKKLRADLATATEALLTVIGGTKESSTRAAAWVRRNLNQS